jgi:hypothetical protein
MPRTGYIYREGVSANTRLLNTQKVKVYSFDAGDATPGGFSQIGLIQTWNPTQTRAIEPVRGVGFGDQIAELAVGVTDLNASCTIMMMYLRDILQVFGYKAGASGIVRSLKHHKWPFDVKEEIVVPSFLKSALDNPTQAATILTWYEGCWMSDYSKSFNMGDTSTAQDCSMMITDVYSDPMNSDFDTLNAENSNAGASKLYNQNA